MWTDWTPAACIAIFHLPTVQITEVKMAEVERGSIDWEELKERLHREILEHEGPDLTGCVRGMSDELPGWREWHWYRSRPEAERNPPGLISADFAEAYRNDPPYTQRPRPRIT